MRGGVYDPDARDPLDTLSIPPPDDPSEMGEEEDGGHGDGNDGIKGKPTNIHDEARRAHKIRILDEALGLGPVLSSTQDPLLPNQEGKMGEEGGHEVKRSMTSSSPSTSATGDLEKRCALLDSVLGLSSSVKENTSVNKSPTMLLPQPHRQSSLDDFLKPR